jgi:hypothetical protein
MNTQKISNALQVLGTSAEAAKSTAKRIESATQRTGDSSPSGHLRALAMSLAKSGSDTRSPVTLAAGVIIEALADFARQAETQERTEAKAKAEAKKAKADTPKAPKASPEALILADLPKAPKAGSKATTGRTATAKHPAPVTITQAETLEAKIARLVAEALALA